LVLLYAYFNDIGLHNGKAEKNRRPTWLLVLYFGKPSLGFMTPQAKHLSPPDPSADNCDAEEVHQLDLEDKDGKGVDGKG